MTFDRDLASETLDGAVSDTEIGLEDEWSMSVLCFLCLKLPLLTQKLKGLNRNKNY